MHSRSRVHSGLAAILVATVVVLAGCGPSNDEGAGAKSGEVSLGAQDNGGHVEVSEGQTLVLTLESNPTTGFRWEVVAINDAVLRQQGDAEFKVASELDPAPPGTGGAEIFRFQGVATGETTLELVHRRPWEDVDPLETFDVQVTVR